MTQDCGTEARCLTLAELHDATGGFLNQGSMAGLNLISMMLSTVAKTRAEISMTLARNVR